MLSFKEITLRCANRTLLSRISFSVQKGELALLMGPSGLGKTTLLRAVVGVHDSSCVSLTGSMTSDWSTAQLQKGYLSQHERLIPWLSVEKNIELPLLLRADTISVVNRKDKEALFDILEIRHLFRRSASVVSGGEAQRILLARSILFSDRLLILDEPWSHLDAPLRCRMLAPLSEWLRLNSFTALVVAHEPEDAVRFSSKAIVFGIHGSCVTEIPSVAEPGVFRKHLFGVLCDSAMEEVVDAA